MSSVLKYYGAELNKRRWELMISAAGADGLEWEGERSRDGSVARTWLRTQGQFDRGRHQRNPAQRGGQAHPRPARRYRERTTWHSY